MMLCFCKLVHYDIGVSLQDSLVYSWVADKQEGWKNLQQEIRGGFG